MIGLTTLAALQGQRDLQGKESVCSSAQAWVDDRVNLVVVPAGDRATSKARIVPN